MAGHLIFYVSARESLPIVGHFRKMDAGFEITDHISRGMRGCQVMKYTEYDGSLLDAVTVGIVFPAHMWGSSIAVCEFVRHLRVRENTYVYAVAVGETVSKFAAEKDMDGMNSLRDFGRIFVRKKLGTEADIYVRFVDRKRPDLSTEERMRGSLEASSDIRFILNGMRYHNMETVRQEQAETKTLAKLPEQTARDGQDGENRVYGYTAEESRVYGRADDGYRLRGYAPEKTEPVYRERTDDYRHTSGAYRERRFVLGNVFLDERMLQGVRLCRGI